MPTEMGSPMYKGNQPSLDAPIVDLLRAAGATIVGKTVSLGPLSSENNAY
jgi:Asp-tRNA(Asn)/Glu-tRNA(Gln) amidotransferase A subunit family amidase